MIRTHRKVTLLGMLLLLVSAFSIVPAAYADTGESRASVVRPLSFVAFTYSGLYPHRQLQARGLANENGVEQWRYTGSILQSWYFGDDGTIRPSGNLAKCLDGDPRQPYNGGRVYIWDCNGATWQIWERFQDGFRNKYSGRCLDAKPAGGDGEVVYQWDCHNSLQQHWYYGRGLW